MRGIAAEKHSVALRNRFGRRSTYPSFRLSSVYRPRCGLNVIGITEKLSEIGKVRLDSRGARCKQCSECKNRPMRTAGKCAAKGGFSGRDHRAALADSPRLAFREMPGARLHGLALY